MGKMQILQKVGGIACVLAAGLVADGVPTLREQGLSFGVDNWTGIFAPAGTPDDVVEALNAVIVEVIESPAVQEQIAKLGTEYKAVDRAAFQAQMQAEKQTWSQVIKAGDIKVN